MGFVIKSLDHTETVDAVSLHEGGVVKFLRGDKHVWLSPAYWTSVTEDDQPVQFDPLVSYGSSSR